MHPYNHLREKHPGQKRAHEMSKHFKRGGRAKHDDEAQDASMIKKAMHDHDKQLHGGKHTDLKNIGGKSHDRYARGGRTSKKGHTHINILVAPKGGDASGAAPAAPPISPGGGGGPPMGGPPMPPKPPMGPMGAGIPGMPPGGPPGMPMRKRGGRIGHTGMTAGAQSGEGRLQKAKKGAGRKRPEK